MIAEYEAQKVKNDVVTAILGKDVIEATIRAIYLEESAILQYKARRVGRPIYFTEQETHERGTQLLEVAHIYRAWEHYKKYGL
jgi:ribulose-5-phosphate 4-epimerase/fuculose-1-phosphate aldolase